MSRIRTIKPEFWTAEQIMELSRDARLLFIGMWNFCDDAGVHPAALKTLKAEVFPGDNITWEEVGRMIEEIIAQGLLIEFEHDNRRWWHVTGWKHQLINRPSPSRYPRPPRNAPLPLAAGQGEPKGQENDASADDLHAETSAESLSTHVGLTDDSVSTHGVLTEHSLSTHGALTAGREGKGKEGKPIKPQAAAAIPSREVAAAAFGAENPDDAVRPAISEPDQEDALSARAIELTAMLRKRGASLQASDPRVRAWAANGVSDAQVLTALEVAQQRRADRGTNQPINAGLIGAILADANRATACRQTASETPYNPFAGAI